MNYLPQNTPEQDGAPSEGDIISRTVANLSKRASRRRKFRQALFCLILLLALSLTIGALVNIYTRDGLPIISRDSLFPQPDTPLSCLRSSLKLFAAAELFVIFEFICGFTVFAPYVCAAVIMLQGFGAGYYLMSFCSELMTSDIIFLSDGLYYLLCVALTALYCAINVIMAAVGISFYSSLRYSNGDEDESFDCDLRYYFTYFMQSSSAVLLLVLVRFIYMYYIV